MKLKEVTNANFKFLDSSESKCYFDKDSTIKKIADLELFVQSSTKPDIKKVLKKLPYNIKNH